MISKSLLTSSSCTNVDQQGKTAVLAGALDVGFLAAAILATQFLTTGDTRIDVIGYMSSGLNIIMYGSPLAAMVRSSLLC